MNSWLSVLFINGSVSLKFSKVDKKIKVDLKPKSRQMLSNNGKIVHTVYILFLSAELCGMAWNGKQP